MTDKTKEMREHEAAGRLDEMSYRERRVLELRFGLNRDRVHSLDEVAEHFKITRERVRQIENQSIKKLNWLREGAPQ